MAGKLHARKLIKRLLIISKKRPATLFLYIVVTLTIGITTYMKLNAPIHPTAYRQLLTVIADGESNGNYNAYFGNAGNTSIKFTDMTIREVQTWQENFISEGKASSAVGRYQIINSTLNSLVKELRLDTNLVFDEKLQDRLAITLMERRGSVAFMKGDVTAELFAHNLSKEWAALPRIIGDMPEASYYAGDGLNASRVSSKNILDAITSFKNAGS